MGRGSEAYTTQEGRACPHCGKDEWYNRPGPKAGVWYLSCNVCRQERARVAAQKKRDSQPRVERPMKRQWTVDEVLAERKNRESLIDKLVPEPEDEPVEIRPRRQSSHALELDLYAEERAEREADRKAELEATIAKAQGYRTIEVD